MRIKKQKTKESGIKSQSGMALILTLMILAILTAMVIEFSYGVYTTTASLNNWRDSQRLSPVSKSGISLAVKTISDIPQSEIYRFPPKIAIPVSGILTDFHGDVVVNVEDENSRFNLNSIVNENQTVNRDAYNIFKRLLKNIGVKEDLADYVVDWIDRNKDPIAARDSEENTKNSFMESTDELLLIKGIDQETYSKLLPYVTVYAADNANPQLININTASQTVIMSLADGITKDMAERIIIARPFEAISAVEKAALGLGLGPAKIVIRPSNFRITAAAEENKIRRLIECVVEIRGSSYIIKYWKEI